MKTRTFFFSRLKNLLLVTLFGAVVFFVISAELVSAQESTSAPFCSLADPVLVSVVNNDPISLDNDFRNSIVVENISELHIGGLTVAVGVFSDAQLSHIYVVEQDKTLEPQTRSVSNFNIEVAALDPGEYTYQVVAVQGDMSNVIAELLLARSEGALALTKEGEAEALLATEVVVNGEQAEGPVSLTPGEPVVVDVISENVTSAPLFDVEVDVVLTRGSIPFGTAVSKIEQDQAKLFPGSSRSTRLMDTFVTPGLHTVFVTQHIPDMLTPVTVLPVQIGDLDGGEYYTRLSSVGIEAIAAEQAEPVAVICLEQLVRGEVTRDRLADVPIQLTRPGSDFESQLVFNELRSSVLSALPLFGDTEVTEVSLLKPRPGDTEETSDFVTAQTLSFTFDCERHDLCGTSFSEVAVEFVQEEPVKTSLWFYAGIIVAALLLGGIVYRRLESEPEVEKIKMKMPTK